MVYNLQFIFCNVLVYDYCTLTHLSYSYQLFHIWICCISCVFVSAFESEAISGLISCPLGDLVFVSKIKKFTN